MKKRTTSERTGRELAFPELPNHDERAFANENPVIEWKQVVHVMPDSTPFEELRARIQQGEPLEARTSPELGRDSPSDAPLGHNNSVFDPRTGKVLYADSVRRYIRGNRLN